MFKTLWNPSGSWFVKGVRGNRGTKVTRDTMQVLWGDIFAFISGASRICFRYSARYGSSLCRKNEDGRSVGGVFTFSRSWRSLRIRNFVSLKTSLLGIVSKSALRLWRLGYEWFFIDCNVAYECVALPIVSAMASRCSSKLFTEEQILALST